MNIWRIVINLDGGKRLVVEDGKAKLERLPNYLEVLWQPEAVEPEQLDSLKAQAMSLIAVAERE